MVLEKNPPKQGLKRLPVGRSNTKQKRFREKSTKTRIETWIGKKVSQGWGAVF